MFRQHSLSFILIYFFIVFVHSGLLPEEIELKGKRLPSCRDGSKPLLGAVEGIVSCKAGCPQGFNCEYPEIRGITQNGICCADLEKLAELYGSERNSDVKKKQDDAIVTISGTAEKLNNVSSVQDSTPDHTKTMVTKILEPGKTNNRTNDDVLTTKAGFKYSCKRQKLQSVCINRGRVPQPVIRWYLNNDECTSYVYNYCEPFISNDRTLRTENECKKLCLAKTA